MSNDCGLVAYKQQIVTYNNERTEKFVVTIIVVQREGIYKVNY